MFVMLTGTYGKKKTKKQIEKKKENELIHKLKSNNSYDDFAGRLPREATLLNSEGLVDELP